MSPGFLRTDFRVRFLAVLGILIFANVLVASTVWRVDLTHNRIYTLSDASRNVMATLDKPLVVKAYFTKDLQQPYASFEQIVKDKLDEYVALSNGRMSYEFKDPTGNTSLEEEARRFGVTPAKIDYRSRDQREIKTAYMGLALVYGDKQEVIPIVRNIDGLEYDLTRLLKQLVSAQKKKTIGFLAGHGEPDLLRAPQQGGSNPLRQMLEENYNVSAVDMSQKAEVPAEVDALVVFAPMQEVSARHQFEIDQFIMAGKPVGFFLPSHMADLRQGSLNPLDNKLDDLMSHYGIKLTKQLVIDRKQNGRTPFPVRQGRMMFQALINYPLYPAVSTFDRESNIVRDVEAMVLPMHQALQLTDAAKARTDLVAKALITSSEFSTTKPEGQLPPVDPQVLGDAAQAEGELHGPFTMAYTLEGTFTSQWSDKPLPNDDSTLDGRSVVKESPKTRILVMGGAEFLRTSGEVFLNMVDWLAQDEDLIAIRSRGESAPPLKVTEPATQRLISLGNVVGIPALFVIFGLIRARARRRSQEA